MYAKLVFPSGTVAGKTVRDIARLVNDSSSGSASLSNLEFINAELSELVAGANSGWSLHSSTPLGSGAISGTDGKYILQGTTATGSKSKYVGIQVNGTWNSASAYNATNCGVCLSNVLDPGTATEFWSYGNSGTSTTYMPRNSINPSTTIYVFAEPRKLMIFGDSIAGITICQGQFESAETPNTTYRQLPPTILFTWGQTDISGSAGAMSGWDISARGGNWYTESSVLDQSSIQWTGSMFSDNSTYPGVVRSLGMVCGDFRGQNGGINYAVRVPTVRIADGTTNGTAITAFNTAAYSYMTVRWEAFGPGARSVATSNWPDHYWGKTGMSTRDSSGNKAIPLRPIVADFPGLCADIYNISDVSKIWWAPAGLGATGDTITIGSDVYVYMLRSSNSGGGILVKRI